MIILPAALPDERNAGETNKSSRISHTTIMMLTDAGTEIHGFIPHLTTFMFVQEAHLGPLPFAPISKHITAGCNKADEVCLGLFLYFD